MRKLLIFFLSGFLFFVLNTSTTFANNIDDYVDITDFDFGIRLGSGVDRIYSETEPLVGNFYIDFMFDVEINNFEKKIKAGDAKTFDYVGEFPPSTLIHLVSNFNLDLLDSNNVIIGKITSTSHTVQGTQLLWVTITFNENIEKVNYSKIKIRLPQSFAHNNVSFSSADKFLTVTFNGITKIVLSRGYSLSETVNITDSISLTSVLNRFNFQIFHGYSSTVSVGRPDLPLAIQDNMRASYFFDEQSLTSDLINIYGRLYYPLMVTYSDTRLSNLPAVDIQLAEKMTTIKQIEGETWSDFKNRVYSKKYQYGVYSSSLGSGYAINAGDITENGWNSEQVSIENSTYRTIRSLADSLIKDNFPKERADLFVEIYGQNGRMKGGIPTVGAGAIFYFPNYASKKNVNLDYEYIFVDPKTNREIRNTYSSTPEIFSVNHSTEVNDNAIRIQVNDKDSKVLLSNVKIYLERKIGDSYQRIDESSSNEGGQVLFSNLANGDYRLIIEELPIGYQNIINFKSDNNEVSSVGEFSLNNKGIFTTIELEKIKSQAVRFTVKDTSNKPIVGEVFSIMRNGQSVGTYPTDNHGVFSLARLNAGEYSLTPTNPLRTGARAFVVEEGKTNTLEVEAVLPVIPEITANGPTLINLGNVNIGQVTRSTIPLDVTYRGDNGYTVTARQSNNTNIDFELNDTLVTTQEKEFTNLNGTADPITTVINYQLNAKTNSNSIKGQQSTNIIFSFKYKL